jgi:stage V sporulation protein B
MKFLKSTLITFFSNIFIFAISIGTTIITSRLLGPTGKGILGVANNVIAFALIILGIGLESANIFHIGKDSNNKNKIIGYNIAIFFGSFIIMILIYMINSIFKLDILLKGLSNDIVIILVIIVPLTLIKSGFINLLLGLQDVAAYNKINILDRILSFIFLVIFILIFKSPFWIIFSTLISSIIVQVILIFILINKYDIKPSFDVKLSKDMFVFGFKSQVSNIIQLLNYRLDVFIINIYLPISQVGIYSNAVALGETMWQVSGTVATLVYPMTSNAADKIELKNFINKVTRITLYIVGLCSIILVLISKPVILLLLGKDFIKSSDALVLLIPGIWLFSISKILSNYIAGIGMMEKNIIASSVSCLCTVVLDLILIPKIGINGASIATSISYISFTIIILYYYMKITKSRLFEILILKKEDIIEIKGYIINFIKSRKG